MTEETETFVDKFLNHMADFGEVRVSDLDLGETHENLLERTLYQMEDMGWVHRSSPESQVWFLGPNLEK